MAPTLDDVPQPLEPLLALITVVQAADHRLTAATFAGACRLFELCTSDASCLEMVQDLAPEFGRPEFLLCAGRDGEPLPAGEESLERYRTTRAEHPGFGSWFRVATLPASGTPALLIARWLCHLAGFRHRTVHLFIDHPTLADHILVQVRGLDKAESPGCFDLPVAGHVAGLESVEDALTKELKEELGLARDTLDRIVRLGSGTLASQPRPGFRNVEHHAVFRGRLSAAAWQSVSAGDHEVAAIALFLLRDLQQMVERFPERVASGLKASLPLYVRARRGETARR